MSEIFEGYERQYCELSTNLSRKCVSPVPYGGALHDTHLLAKNSSYKIIHIASIVAIQRFHSRFFLREIIEE